jgi:hypothetical protein
MWDFSIAKAIGALMRTWPFVALRLVVYFAITLAYLLATGTGAGIGYVIGNFGDDPSSFSVWGGLVGVGLVSAALYFAREYILYMVKAGHIAVLVEVLDGHAIPEDRSQIDYAQKMVRARFAQANILFALDQIIKGVLRIVTGTIFTIASILPIPAIQQIARLVNAILTLSLTYVDEIILAYNIRTRTENPWDSSRQAIVLYAQNYGTFVKNAIWLAIFMWGGAFLVFLVLLSPAAAVMWLMPGPLASWSFVLAILLAWSLKAAVLEPFAIACLMQAYFKKIEGQSPDPAWDAKLSSLSTKFRTMGERAAAWVRPPEPVPPASATMSATG